MNEVYTWQNDLYPLVTKRFSDRYAERTDIMKAVIGEETIDRVDSREEGIGGYGEVPDYDGTTITELGQKRGYVKIYTPAEKAAQVSVTYKKAKVDMSGEAKRTGTRLADSLSMTRLLDFYRLFGNAFNASYAGADGKAWAAADHPISSDSGAGTFSNLLTSEFSISAITTAQTTANRFVTFDGLPFMCNFDLVLISPELEPKAKEFFGKEAKLIPESAENGANPVYGMKYHVVGGGADFGFSAKQWAVADSMLLKEYAKCVNITKPMVMYNKESSNPLIAKYTGYADYIMGFSEARMIIFSNPA
ncbi:MAG: hypothetical protein JM58_09480 [Peptococcaceae bacterium BICA1-8]|nr:MAG: hypothetical protein JM58_09480 [Peptococcaceae bacterium BICA1-8]